MKRNWKFAFLLATIGISNHANGQAPTPPVVLINVSTASRIEIADLLVKVDKLRPKVIGVDLLFQQQWIVEEDSLLVHALCFTKNLVMARSIVNYTGIDSSYLRFAITPPEFLPEHVRSAFVDSIVGADGSLRSFSIHEKVSGDQFRYFSIEVAMVYDSVRTKRFLAKHSAKFMEADVRTYKDRYKVLSYEDREQFSGEDIKGKIVLMGALGPGDEDKHFSIMNENRNRPDLYGVEFLAIVVNQVLAFPLYKD